MAFWSDNWLEQRPLSEMIVRPVCEEELENRASLYWDNQTWWSWGRHEQHLPASTLVKLASMGLENENSAKDSFI